MTGDSSKTPRGSSVSVQEPWTTRRLLAWIEEHLGAKGVDSPRVCAQMLVAHVLQCDRLRLYMEADRPASASELEALRALVQRAARHEPVQYVVGEAWFWSKRFAVGPSTLIPRPCTEHLVEMAVQAARARAVAAQSGPASDPASPRAVRLLDIGTGTGCIPVSVALALHAEPAVPVHIVATDVVPAALELAWANAAAHAVAERMEFIAGDLFTPLAARGWEGSFDVLVSNPPYVADNEWAALAPNVREFEPRTALAGGPDGLSVLGPLLAEAHLWLRPGGALIVEIGHAQHERALAEARANQHLRNAAVHKDFEGFWRVVTAERV